MTGAGGLCRPEAMFAGREADGEACNPPGRVGETVGLGGESPNAAKRSWDMIGFERRWYEDEVCWPVYEATSAFLAADRVPQTLMVRETYCRFAAGGKSSKALVVAQSRRCCGLVPGSVRDEAYQGEVHVL